MGERLNRLWQSPKSKWLLGIPLGGFVSFLAGAIFMGGSYASIELSSTDAFCGGACHEMEAFVVPEWKESTHYNNQHGVRAGCADCHIPEAFGPKMARKIKALRVEVPAWITGKIDTREKFEEHRYAMAEAVWEEYRANDSLACRNCHSREAMDLEEQGRRAKRSHTVEHYEKTGKTCIDCHTGLAHAEPTPPLPDVGEAEDTGTGS